MPAQAPEHQQGNPAGEGLPLGDNLALLYQGILTNVVRLRSGKSLVSAAGDPNVAVQGFQTQILVLLDAGEKEALRLCYPKNLIEDATYAVIVYLDESILTSNDPHRHLWSALHPHLAERAKESSASKEVRNKMKAKRLTAADQGAVGGIEFFRRLDDLLERPNSKPLGDTLEVYLLCLLLGYRGRYKDGNKDDTIRLSRIIEDLRIRITEIRGEKTRLSPEGLCVAPPHWSFPIQQDGSGIRTRWACFGFFGAVLIAWGVFKWLLVSQASELISYLTAN